MFVGKAFLLTGEDDVLEEVETVEKARSRTMDGEALGSCVVAAVGCACVGGSGGSGEWC